MSSVIYCISIAIVVLSTQVEYTCSEENDERKHDFDDKLGGTHEFKMEVPAGKEQCFFQFADKGAQLFVSFQVIRGADRMVTFYLMKSVEIIKNYHASEGQETVEVHEPAYYQVCFDNFQDRFGSKLVYVYVVTLVPYAWEIYANEEKELIEIAENLTTTLASVEYSLIGMNRYQLNSRLNVIRDWYLAIGNQNYIGYWSIAQSILVVVAAVAQVIFLRRLFTVPVVTKSSKPRA